MMVIDLIGFDRRNIKELEAFLRERKDASNFIDALTCNYYFVSNDFLREFKNEFKIAFKHANEDDRWHFKYTRDIDFYHEIFGKE